MGLRVMLRRLRYLGRWRRADQAIGDELQFHIDSRVDELEQQGYTRQAALARAAKEFGPRTRTLEDTRAAWQFRWLEDLLADLGYAARVFRRRPTFALTAIACLGLGIGANALIFSLVNTALLRPMPYPDADRIVLVRFTPPNQTDQKLGTNAGSYFFVRDHSRSFERMGAMRITGFSVANDEAQDSERQWVQGGGVSPGLTDVMGVPPLLGRWFHPDDRGLNVVITHGLWQRMYGGAKDVVGRPIRMDAGTGTIIGVTRPGYQTLTPEIDLWIQQTDQNLANALRSPNRVFYIFGRLKPGVTIDQVRAEMRTLEVPLGREMAMNEGWGIAVDSLREVYVGYLRRPVLILQGAVFLLLVIACANVAGLLLAQAMVRQKELVVRAALGSTRNRIVRQLLAENLLLSFAAGAVGIAIAWVGLGTLVNTALSAYPDLQGVRLDWTVIGFAGLVSLATTVVFGLLPALQISKTNLIEAVRDGSRTTTSGPARSRLRGAFVVAQVSLALVLLIGTGLMIRSLGRLNAVDPGLNPDGVVTVSVPLPRSLYRNRGQNTAAGGLLVEFDARFSSLTERMRERLQTVPGVQGVAVSTPPPLGGEPRRVLFEKHGERNPGQNREPWSAEWYPVSAGYIETLRIPVVQGRTFTAQEANGSRPVAMINASMARRYWPNESPIGRLLQTDVLDDPPREIVGVVGDVRQDRYQPGPSPQIYVPRVQLPYRMDMTMSLDLLVTTFVVRTTEEPPAVIPSLRAAIREVDPTVSVSSVSTVEEYAAGQLRELSQYATMLGLFGVISVTLAVIGILGVMAQMVSQRANEIAIRLALGAQARSVLGILLGQGVRLVGAGLAAGLMASLVLTPLLRTFLWGVTTTDPLTLALVVLALGLIGVIACYLPARRALKVQPVAALRGE